MAPAGSTAAFGCRSVEAMDFDPSRAPVEPRTAASAILLREPAGGGGPQCFLLRRHKRSSFMSSAYVFPGGAADADDGDLRVTAARELFEEAGVLPVRETVESDALDALRRRLLAGEGFAALLDEARLSLELDALVPLSHWITPSAEPKRFSAHFFVCAVPAGQTASCCDVETFDELWVSAAEALDRSAELRLPPPQIRILGELAAAETVAGAVELARGRAGRIDPILPKVLPTPEAGHAFALVLPWDPQYGEALGEGAELSADSPLGGGASRFVHEDGGWRHVKG